MRKRLLKQYAVLGFTEGMLDMIKNQEENPPEDFLKIWKKMKSSIYNLASVLRREGFISKKDTRRVRSHIESLKKEHMPDGKFTPMLAISFCSDLIIEQIHFTKGKKKSAFEKVFNTVKEFDEFFDPKKSYEETDGFDMAESYRKVSNT